MWITFVPLLVSSARFSVKTFTLLTVESTHTLRRTWCCPVVSGDVRRLLCTFRSRGHHHRSGATNDWLRPTRPSCRLRQITPDTIDLSHCVRAFATSHKQYPILDLCLSLTTARLVIQHFGMLFFTHTYTSIKLSSPPITQHYVCAHVRTCVLVLTMVTHAVLHVSNIEILLTQFLCMMSLEMSSKFHEITIRNLNFIYRERHFAAMEAKVLEIQYFGLNLNPSCKEIT